MAPGGLDLAGFTREMKTVISHLLVLLATVGCLVGCSNLSNQTFHLNYAPTGLTGEVSSDTPMVVQKFGDKRGGDTHQLGRNMTGFGVMTGAAYYTDREVADVVTDAVRETLSKLNYKVTASEGVLALSGDVLIYDSNFVPGFWSVSVESNLRLNLKLTDIKTGRIIWYGVLTGNGKLTGLQTDRPVHHQHAAEGALRDAMKKLAESSDFKNAVLAFASKPTATVASRLNPPNAPPAMAESIAPIGHRWAVVIGVSEYQDNRIPGLRYGERDAQTLYQWLTAADGGRFAPDDTKLLLGREATLRNMKEALNEWLRRAQPEDLVLIYFSGHGAPESPDHSENLFLLPYDTDSDKIASTAFPMWDIETALKRFIQARKVVVITDACHAGGVGDAYAGRKGISIEDNRVNQGLQSLASVNDGVAVITSAGSRQLSQESERWGNGHGVFTYCLLKGLQGGADYNKTGRVTLGELIPYVSEQVRRETNGAQSPEVAGKFDPALSMGN
jgi:uncharacterized caspase-like protein